MSREIDTELSKFEEIAPSAGEKPLGGLLVTSVVKWEGNIDLRRWVRIAAIAVLAVCSLMIDVPRVFSVSSQDASTAIVSAEHALQAAFVNVSDAERAGVNVTGLLSRLDDAGSALTAAEAAVNSGNYSGGVSEAVTSETVADSVARDATALKSEAGSWFSSLWIIFIAELASAGVLVMILAFTWLWFKRHYSRKLSDSRPRVTA